MAIQLNRADLVAHRDALQALIDAMDALEAITPHQQTVVAPVARDLGGRLLALIASGMSAPKEFARETGVSAGTIRAQLAYLLKRGEITVTGQTSGRRYLPAKGRR